VATALQLDLHQTSVKSLHKRQYAAHCSLFSIGQALFTMAGYCSTRHIRGHPITQMGM
jgi:hypothetical protein